MPVDTQFFASFQFGSNPNSTLHKEHLKWGQANVSFHREVEQRKHVNLLRLKKDQTHMTPV